MKPRTCYKLTDENLRTHGNTQWVLGEWRETSGEGDLCGAGWLHAYRHPLLAVLMNPVHAKISEPKLFRCEWTGEVKSDHGLKIGVTRLRLVEQIALPAITTNERVRFGVLCAMRAYNEEGWLRWARGWLDCSDRSANAAWAAEAAEAEAAAARAAEWAVKADRQKRLPLIRLARQAIREERALQVKLKEAK